MEREPEGRPVQSFVPRVPPLFLNFVLAALVSTSAGCEMLAMGVAGMTQHRQFNVTSASNRIELTGEVVDAQGRPLDDVLVIATSKWRERNTGGFEGPFDVDRERQQRFRVSRTFRVSRSGIETLKLRFEKPPYLPREVVGSVDSDGSSSVRGLRVILPRPQREAAVTTAPATVTGPPGHLPAQK